jgi:hypothetical protein
VLTLQGSEKQLKPLATEAVSSGGSSGSGKLVPAILLTFKEKEREHEQPRHGRDLKQSPAGCDTHWNTVVTGRAPRRRSRPELEKSREVLATGWVREGAWGALGPHEGDEDAGLLNLARGELGTVNFRERDVEFSPAVDSGNGRRRPRRCSSGGEGEPEASTSPGDPGSKQLRACARARGAARTAAALDREPVIPIGSL